MMTNEEKIMCQMIDRLLEASNEGEKKEIREKMKLIKKITKIESVVPILYFLSKR